MSPPKALDASRLIHRCVDEDFDFETTADLKPLDEPLGQERALEAIAFSTGIERAGYNLYVMGSPGLGRHRLVRAQLESEQDTGAPSDWCYVSNFQEPHRPDCLELPKGRGAALKKDMEQLVEDLLNAIPAAFQSDEYRRRAQEISARFKKLQDDEASAIEAVAKSKSIALFDAPTGYNLAPLRDGKVLSGEEYEALPQADKDRYNQGLEEVKEALRAAMAKIPLWQRELRRAMQALERDIIEITVGQLIAEVQRDYQELPNVVTYLEGVRKDVITNGAAFRNAAESEAEGEGEALSADSPRFTRYRVNLLVSQEGLGRPIVYEDNPTYPNLIGRIEHVARFGTLVTDFTLIKPGALHRANGGYLILDAMKVLSNPFAWDGLKRSLSSGEVRIEPLERLWSLAGTISLEPEPVPVRLKVILVGERLLYYLLKAYDPEFASLFKVAADFAEHMVREDSRDMMYARLIATLQQQESMRPLDRSGVGRLVEWAARRVGDGNKLSLHIGELLDLLQEADHVAAKADSAIVDGHTVTVSIARQQRRLAQIKENLHDAILRNVIMIDTDGVQLAQVNGLSIIEVADQAFGIPSRISATARIGAGELIDIERETEMGGPIHAKGVMILAAYLAYRFARHQPLSVAASLVFEQSYGQVEGDSASVAELCALLSAIGDLGLKQSLAVTGSINQHGQVQAIGGVNEKIEGFFEICKARGLTGEQGAIIPEANVKDLMLSAELRQAAEAGQFSVYAVRHVDEVMALLTGMEAGHPDANGLYAEGTVNHRVQNRLFEWTELRQQYAAGPKSADSTGD